MCWCQCIHFDSMCRNRLLMFRTTHIENSTIPESRCWRRMSARDCIGPSRLGMRWVERVLEGAGSGCWSRAGTVVGNPQRSKSIR